MGTYKLLKQPLQTSIIVVVVLMAVSAGWAQQEVFVSIRSAFQKTLEPAVLVSIASTLVLLVGVVVLVEIRRSDARQKARAKIGWDKFFAAAAERALNSAEVSKLESLVSYAGIMNAEAVFVSATIFENVLEHYYRKNGGVANLREDELLELRRLRDKVGFGQIPVETPFVSSRQFRVSDRVLVQMVEHQRGGVSSIENNDERWWVIANPFPHEVTSGTQMKIALTRGGDAEYTIETRVLRSEKGKIFLDHTRSLHRKQLRNWVRIDVNFPSRTRVIEAEGAAAGELFAGRILDLSGGGLSVRLPKKFAVGSRFTMEFDLPEVHLKGVEVQVTRVASSASGADEMYHHSMSFINLAKPLQEKIVHFVFERQRQDAQWR